MGIGTKNLVLLVFFSFIIFQTLLLGTAFAKLVSDVPPLERLPVDNVRIVDAFDNRMHTLHEDQIMLVSADLLNRHEERQHFVYFVQIQDEEGFVVHLSYMTGSIVPQQMIRTASSWLPSNSGEYFLQVFVWSSFNGPTPLSPPTEIHFTVTETENEQPKTTEVELEDIESLVQILQTKTDVEITNETANVLEIDYPATLIKVNGKDVYVAEYENHEAAKSASTKITDMIDKNRGVIDYICPVQYYFKDNLVVYYNGVNVEVLSLLETTLGAHFDGLGGMNPDPLTCN